MTTAKPQPASPATPAGPAFVRIPDPPERYPDDMTGFIHLSKTGSVAYLTDHFGNPDTTVIGGKLYLQPELHTPQSERRVPDLYIAFDVDADAYYARNAYVIAEQGKPPDFVLEIASPTTADQDVGSKRDDYESWGVAEYWRFDRTGQYHGERLAADRLVDGRYQPIDIARVSNEEWQGYSAALDLYLAWSAGQLLWIDPATSSPITTLADERAARQRAEARVLELEAELQRLRAP